jgi:hemoglobin-like flavoprotein
MTPEQVALVQSTWQKVVPIAGTAADLFYDKVFELAPGVRSMFPDDMTSQKAKLVSIMNTVVTSLHEIETLVPTIEELGRFHGGKDVKPEHYGVVAEALLWTLEQGLEDAWSLEVKQAGGLHHPCGDHAGRCNQGVTTNYIQRRARLGHPERAFPLPLFDVL